MDQNLYASTVPPLPCPVCGASPVEREWRRFLSGYTKILSEKHRIQGSNITPLVCTQCGFVQLFVDPQDFRKEPPV
jgi:hypothetical protein